MFGVSGLRALQLSERSGGRSSPLAVARYLSWTGSWLVGHVLGGALVGGLLGSLAAPRRLGDAGLAGLAVLCLAGAIRELRLGRSPLPCWQRQVNRAWMWRLPWHVVALGYGLQLGSGVATRIKIATTFAALGCALLSGSAVHGALIMGAFGLVRALPPAALGPVLDSPDASRRFSGLIDRHESRVRRLNGLALLAATVLLAAAWWGDRGAEPLSHPGPASAPTTGATHLETPGLG